MPLDLYPDNPVTRRNYRPFVTCLPETSLLAPRSSLRAAETVLEAWETSPLGPESSLPVPQNSPPAGENSLPAPETSPPVPQTSLPAGFTSLSRPFTVGSGGLLEILERPTHPPKGELRGKNPLFDTSVRFLSRLPTPPRFVVVKKLVRRLFFASAFTLSHPRGWVFPPSHFLPN